MKTTHTEPPSTN